MSLRRLVGEGGTAVVEFALVAPILFLLIFGVIDFARALNYYNDLTQLAGQGARAAAVYQNPAGGAVTASSIQCQLIKTYADSPELRKGISVNITPPVNFGDPVSVKTSYTFNFLPFVRKIPLTLSATSTHRAEVVPSTGFDPTGTYTEGTCP